jgi:tetratricopeptide (TPR) repeat protein
MHTKHTSPSFKALQATSRTLVAFLAVLCPLLVVAQGAEESHSLRNNIEKFQYYRDTNFEQALFFATRSAAEIDSLSSDESHAEALDFLADNSEFREFRYTKALDYKTRAHDIHTRLGNRSECGRLMADIGRLYFKVGNYHDALSYSSRALDEATELGDTLSMREATMTIELVDFFYHKDVAKAMEYNRQVADNYSGSEQAHQAIRALNNRFHYDPSPNEVEEIVARSEAIHAEYGCRDVIINTYLNMAMQQVLFDDLDLCRHYLDLAEPLVTNFKEEGYNTEERGSYLFLVGRELTAGEADTLTLDYKTMLLLRETGYCCITEVYSLHRLKSAPNCDTLALREKQTIIVDGHSFESSTVTLLHYIKEPLENAPLIPPENFDPHPTYRPMPERFDTEWLKWLTEEDMGDSGKYPYVCTAGVYKTDYDGYEGPMTPSAWALWPYDIEEQTYSEYSHFFLDLRLRYADVNAYTGLGTEGSPYEWKIFYRPAGSTEDYKRIEGSSLSASVGGNVVSIKFNLMDYGCEMSLNEDGSAKEYYMIFFLVEKDTDEIVVWTDLAVKWTDSSEAFYQDALRLGLIKDPKS